MESTTMTWLPKCKGCGKLFPRVREPYCVDCLQAQEDDFQRVVEYLHEHSTADMAAIRTATGVSHRILMEFLRSGRLARAAAEAVLTMNCPRCGAPTQLGRGCIRCTRTDAAERAEEKRKLMAQFNTHRTQRPKPVSDATLRTSFFSYHKRTAASSGRRA